jgi:hypothetical protein
LATCFVEHIWIEEGTDVFIITLERLENEERWDYEEDLSLPVLELFRECFVLFTRCFDHRAEMDQLVALFMVHEIG